VGDEAEGAAQGSLKFPRWPTPFFLDESIQPRVRRAIASIRHDVLHAEMPNCPVSRGEEDEIWLPKAGKKDWLVIMRDERILTRKRQRDALLEHGVRAFVMTGSGEFLMWPMLELLVRRWPKFEEIGSSGQSGPYLYSVTGARVKQLLP
jgi:hypothetical protein